MFEIMDFLQGNANLEQLRLHQIEEEEKKRKQQEEEYNKLYKESLEGQRKFIDSQDIREQQLRDLPNTKQRLGQETDDLWKERFGFSPVGKKGVGGFFQKLGAGLLEGGNRLNKNYTPIGEEAYKRAQKSYKDEYDKLLGVERLESQQFMNQGRLQQEMMNNIQRQNLGQKKLDLQKEQGEMMAKLKNRQIDEQAKAAKGKQEVAEFNAYLNSLKTEAQNDNLEAKTEYQKMVNHISKEMGIPPNLVNDNTMAMFFAKQKEKEYQDETLKNLGLIKEQKSKGKEPAKRVDINKEWYQDENGIMRSRVSSVNLIDTKSGEVTNAPVNQKKAGLEDAAKGVQYGITKRNGRYFPEDFDQKQALAIVKNTPPPQKVFGEGNLGQKEGAEKLKQNAQWDDLMLKSTNVNQIIFNGLADKTFDWQKYSKQNPLSLALRQMTGNVGAAESTVKQNDILNLLEHIKARTSGRPAQKLYDEVAKTMQSPYADEQTFAKQQGTMHLLIQLSQRLEKDERWAERLEDIQKLSNKNKEDYISFGEAFKQEVETAYQMSKAGYKNYVPDLDRVFDMATSKLIRDKDKKRNIR